MVKILLTHAVYIYRVRTDVYLHFLSVEETQTIKDYAYVP